MSQQFTTTAGPFEVTWSSTQPLDPSLTYGYALFFGDGDTFYRYGEGPASGSEVAVAFPRNPPSGAIYYEMVAIGLLVARAAPLAEGPSSSSISSNGCWENSIRPESDGSESFPT